MRRHLAGKIFVLIEIVLSLLFLVAIKRSGILPDHYFMALLAVLAVLAIFNMLLQFLKSKIFILGVILSILISVLSGIGTVAVQSAVQLMDQISDLDYQTDNMVAVVRADDPAKELSDIANYRFGIQNGSDTENTEKMIADIEEKLGRDIKVQEYPNIQEEAEALLSGRIEAAVYNDAFTSILEEYEEDYSSHITVIHQYGVETPAPTVQV